MENSSESCLKMSSIPSFGRLNNNGEEIMDFLWQQLRDYSSRIVSAEESSFTALTVHALSWEDV